MDVETGISKDNREKMAEALTKLLADTYVLYLKTHAYHWNVTGPRFKTLHEMFEEQYTELWEATDEIAERIRALGFNAPMGWEDFAKRTSLKEDNGVPSADQMVVNLTKGHETVAKTAKDVVALADELDDVASDDLVAPRVTYHEKTAWMLRATAE
ncbi:MULTISPECIES: Dps family protein [Euryhalocaulis]|uniref:Dps family protein n=1 Tax=Euryhalocaulis TaxID=1712422 RepID=UPI00039C0AF4|nr:MULTISPECIES: Dps family protein [Euryhalocaulis]MBA4800589.1 DNA starvation/stationary phase protection protein [Euryhalocaulis sp.]